MKTAHTAPASLKNREIMVLNSSRSFGGSSSCCLRATRNPSAKLEAIMKARSARPSKIVALETALDHADKIRLSCICPLLATWF